MSTSRRDVPALTTHGFQNHAVRSEKWRYIRYADGSEELYDHEKDPYEWTNLGSKFEFKKIREQLAKSLPKQDAVEPKSRATRRRQQENPAQ